MYYFIKNLVKAYVKYEYSHTLSRYLLENLNLINEHLIEFMCQHNIQDSFRSLSYKCIREGSQELYDLLLKYAEKYEYYESLSIIRSLILLEKISYKTQKLTKKYLIKKYLIKKYFVKK